MLPEASVDLKISGLFYQDMKTAFMQDLTDGETKKSIDVILQNLILKKATTPKEFRLYVMFTIISHIEREAELQGKIVDVPMPTEEPDQSSD